MAVVSARVMQISDNIVDQDHRRIERLTGPGFGFGSLRIARRTLAGYEAVAMLSKGQIRQIGGFHMNAQPAFVAELIQIAA